MELTNEAIAQRLLEARRAIGLTQSEVGKQVGMATSTISSIEAGKRSVSGPELHAFARVYHRPISYFFEQSPADSPGFQYLFRAAEPEVLDRVSIIKLEEMAQDYVLLEELVGAAPLPTPPDYSTFGFRTNQDAETMAEMERGRLGLGDAPVPDLMNLLDGVVGIRTFLVPVSQSAWSGVIVRGNDTRLCIAVNSKEESYRRNFDLAHEYSHALVHMNGQRDTAARIDSRTVESASSRAEERFADAFASAFLMPNRAVLKALEQTLRANGGRFTDFDLVHMAMQFGVSGQALSNRLVSLRKISRQMNEEYWKSQGSYKQLAKELGYSTEDWESNPVLPRRFRYLAMKAYEEELISLARLAELLREDYYELRSKLGQAAEEPDSARPAGVIE